MSKLPIYKVIVNEEMDITGMDFNSFVTNPAHESNFIKFSKQTYSIDEEKRIVTGVMISADKEIYRNSPEPCYYVFEADQIKIIQRKFMKNGYTQNVNLQHEEKTNGAILTDIYIASNSDANYPNIPQAFENQGIADGSLFASYYVEDDALWQRVKNGEFNGFSIEIWSDLMKVENTSKFQKQIKMSKPQRKSLVEMLMSKIGFSDSEETTEDVATTLAHATSVDGAVFYYDGEIGEGTTLFTDEGMTTPLAGGNYQITISDESVKLITVSEDGVIIEIDDFVEEEEEIEEIAEAFNAAIAEVEKCKSENETLRTELEALKADNEALKTKVNELETINKGGKFQAQPSKGGQTSGKTAREMFRNRKNK